MSLNDSSSLQDLMSSNQLQELQHINLQLAALGQPICQIEGEQNYLQVADSLLKNYVQQRRLLAKYRCPADQRIQDFLNAYLASNGITADINLPGETFVLDRKGKRIIAPFSNQ